MWGRWLMAAKIESCLWESICITLLPAACHNSWTLFSASVSVFSVGVRTQILFSKRVDTDASNPEFSVPAIGWPPIKKISSGIKVSIALTTGVLTLPTSLSIAPGWRCGIISSAIEVIVLTGVPIITRSASSSPSSKPTKKLSIIPISQAFFILCLLRPNPVTVSASFFSFIDKARDPPISPSPAIAMFLNFFKTVFRYMVKCFRLYSRYL